MAGWKLLVGCCSGLQWVGGLEEGWLETAVGCCSGLQWVGGLEEGWLETAGRVLQWVTLCGRTGRWLTGNCWKGVAMGYIG